MYWSSTVSWAHWVYSSWKRKFTETCDKSCSSAYDFGYLYLCNGPYSNCNNTITVPPSATANVCLEYQISWYFKLQVNRGWGGIPPTLAMTCGWPQPTLNSPDHRSLYYIITTGDSTSEAISLHRASIYHSSCQSVQNLASFPGHRRNEAMQNLWRQKILGTSCSAIPPDAPENEVQNVIPEEFLKCHISGQIATLKGISYMCHISSSGLYIHG